MTGRKVEEERQQEIAAARKSREGKKGFCSSFNDFLLDSEFSRKAH